MIDPFYVLALILVVGLFYVVPILLIIFLNKLIRNKWNNRVANLITALLVIGFAILIYRDFNPPNSQYISNFEHYAELDFPESGEIIHKTSSSSIFDFGGTTYCSLVNLNESDYSKFIDRITKSDFIEKDTYYGSKEIDKLFSMASDFQIEKVLTIEKPGMEYSIIQLHNSNSIIFYYSRW